MELEAKIEKQDETILKLEKCLDEKDQDLDNLRTKIDKILEKQSSQNMILLMKKNSAISEMY